GPKGASPNERRGRQGDRNDGETERRPLVAARTSGRLGKWLVSGPPLLYLTFFFAIPTLIMVLASFRTPGEFGGLAPFIHEAGQFDLNLESYARFFEEPVYAEVFLKS